MHLLIASPKFISRYDNYAGNSSIDIFINDLDFLFLYLLYSYLKFW